MTSTYRSDKLTDFPLEAVESVEHLEEGVAGKSAAGELVPEERVVVEVEESTSVSNRTEHATAETGVELGAQGGVEVAVTRG